MLSSLKIIRGTSDLPVAEIYLRKEVYALELKSF